MDKSLYCINCETKFQAGGWYNCQNNPTRKHVVEKKIYYSTHDNYSVNAIPESYVLGNHGERIHITGKIVTFTGGVYETDDPELQEVLNVQAALTKEQYMEKRMTPELKANRDRKVISDQQELIDKLKEENEVLKTTGRKLKEEKATDPVMTGAGRRGRSRESVAAD